MLFDREAQAKADVDGVPPVRHYAAAPLRRPAVLQMADILLHDGVTPGEVAHKGEWSD
jgi:hypothetical protein